MLDISWNSCGSSSSKLLEVGNAWGDGLSENRTLLHLDLSFNKILRLDSEILAQKIKINHSMYGFHYSGNDGKIDNLGFIRPNIDSEFSPRE